MQTQLKQSGNNLQASNPNFLSRTEAMQTIRLLSVHIMTFS